MSEPKIIKRYANRKLYDTEQSCYVTLDDIAGMIRDGAEVRIVDNKTGEDLSSVTLAQIIFETEKKKSFMPLTLLRDLVQNGSGTLSELARGRVERVQSAASELKETAHKLKADLGDRLERLSHRAKEGFEDSGAPLRLTEFIKSSQKALDDLQKSIEARVKGSMDKVSRYATVGQEMDEIRQRLAALEERLSKLP